MAFKCADVHDEDDAGPSVAPGDKACEGPHEVGRREDDALGDADAERDVELVQRTRGWAGYTLVQVLPGSSVTHRGSALTRFSLQPLRSRPEHATQGSGEARNRSGLVHESAVRHELGVKKGWGSKRGFGGVQRGGELGACSRRHVGLAEVQSGCG